MILEIIFNKIKSLKSKILKKIIISNWKKNGKPIPTPHEVKQLIIEEYKKKTNFVVLVETGTYVGAMIEAQRKNFKYIYSIELSEYLWKMATKRFLKYSNIEIVQGDSSKVLYKIVRNLNQPAIFWLDGHYSAGITAKGELDCPIYGELDAILTTQQFNHLILIDDARLFNGTNDYPTIEALSKYIKSKNSNYNLVVKDDIIRYEI